ncbi:hypothetical protein [Liquorilactobacillus hordei]|uniref:Uncharacterized protein n=1 Tax=Liquorilactobacillus hordei DSM 19519 TaxID=1423759 RepID=A0A0R1MJE1_9LACO|nr:hypothetical protein [Liquorilactobacillus hordei]KRL08046.1 hypothetical protein FC92_GL001120 [Liquorilactobacillus hordei DSM 19519]QYH51010.1 hypothetical protein G6O70_00145 [Liquorilactobacillus hordei DSM 19519]
MKKNYFTRNEALNEIKKVLENGYTGAYADLEDVVFCNENYISYKVDAENPILEYGVFDAMERIKQYELENYGVIDTDFSDPVRVANSLWHIIGYNVIQDLETLSEFWNDDATIDKNREVIAEIEGLLD